MTETRGTTTTSRPVATRTLRAMASPITLMVVEPGPSAQSCLDRAEAVIRDVGLTCTRFEPDSPLSRANAEPDSWHEVPATLGRAVQEAAGAHTSTAGLFDPRVLDLLLSWGYDRTLSFADGFVHDGAATVPKPDATGPWRPRVIERDGIWRIHLGGRQIDLGGIGKGLAVRWAAAELAGAGSGFMVDAGGDCAFGGIGPEDTVWNVGVEDPAGGPEPLLVLALTDTGCATSSTRRLRWRSGGKAVHHLVDPRTGLPGGDGLAAVTVVAADPAWAEVWTKALFLAGAAGVRRRAESLGLAAAWVGDDGVVGSTGLLDALTIWRPDHG